LRIHEASGAKAAPLARINSVYAARRRIHSGTLIEAIGERERELAEITEPLFASLTAGFRILGDRAHSAFCYRTPRKPSRIGLPPMLTGRNWNFPSMGKKSV
jgi:hypothetical protein